MEGEKQETPSLGVETMELAEDVADEAPVGEEMMKASFGEVSSVLEGCSMRLKKAAYELEALKKQLPEMRARLWRVTMQTMDMNADIICDGVAAMTERQEQ